LIGAAGFDKIDRKEIQDGNDSHHLEYRITVKIDRLAEPPHTKNLIGFHENLHCERN
jgi:hypothetical protein